MSMQVPLIESSCYACGASFWVYMGCPVRPPNPAVIKTREDIKRVYTCRGDRCEERELARQDALFNMVIAPERERYFAAKNKTTPQEQK